jgi:hypothetical protein
MKTFRWPTTLLLICGAAALLAAAAFDLAGPNLSMGAVILAIALVLLALLFGKRGV